jgi:hypothetical protein
MVWKARDCWPRISYVITGCEDGAALQRPSGFPSYRKNNWRRGCATHDTAKMAFGKNERGERKRERKERKERKREVYRFEIKTFLMCTCQTHNCRRLTSLHHKGENTKCNYTQEKNGSMKGINIAHGTCF